MTEQYPPTSPENVSVFKIPRIRNAVASIAMVAAVGSLESCAHEKHCEVIRTHTMQLGETVWGTIDSEIPAADKKGTDVRERMDWIKQVNPDMEIIGHVQAGDTINIPGNCQ